MLYHYFFLILQFLPALAQFGPENGVKKSEPKSILIQNARIYVSPTQVLEKADMLVVDGKIKEIGSSIKDNQAVVIDYSGKTILPSFVELYSNVGQPKATFREGGFRTQSKGEKEGAYYWNEAIHPEFKAASSFAIDAKANETLMQQGFGYAVSHLMDGMVRGTGALVSLGNDQVNKQMMKGDAAQFLSFSKGSSSDGYPSSQMGSIALMRQALFDLSYYSNSPQSEFSISLDSWSKQLKLPMFFKTEDKWEILRAEKIAKEHQLNFCYIGSGNEYAAIDALKNIQRTIIIPINFPEPFELRDPYIARQIPLSDLKHWELAPSNPLYLYQNGIAFCITTHGLKSAEQFWKNLRLAISRGLPADAALAALTVNPAKELGVANELGTLETGKFANFSVYSSDPFTTEAQLLDAWIQGEKTQVKALAGPNIVGKYNLLLDGEKYELEIEGTNERPSGKVKLAGKVNAALMDTTTKKASVQMVENDITLQFSSFEKAKPGIIQLHGKMSRNAAIFEGDGTNASGVWLAWSGIRTDKASDPVKVTEIKKDTSYIAVPWLPLSLIHI